jgi:hypothetical protein
MNQLYVKRVFILSFLLVTYLIFTDRDYENRINSVIGDQSFIATYNEHPTDFMDENLRISTHLNYVIRMLERKDLSHLTDQVKQNRQSLLQSLKRYVADEQFPKNYDYKEGRRPCFIDEEGNICAVGYLIEQSVGRDVAEKINAIYKYDYVKTMDLDLIDEWANNHGFTMNELAMIQPNYEFYKKDNKVKSNYIKSSAAYTLGNGILIGINSYESITKKKRSVWAPFTGFALGAAQIIHGLNNYPKAKKYSTIGAPEHKVTNQGEKNLSHWNISIGTASILLASYNLFFTSPDEKNSFSWDIKNSDSKKRGNTTTLKMSYQF